MALCYLFASKDKFARYYHIYKEFHADMSKVKCAKIVTTGNLQEIAFDKLANCNGELCVNLYDWNLLVTYTSGFQRL